MLHLLPGSDLIHEPRHRCIPCWQAPSTSSQTTSKGQCPLPVYFYADHALRSVNLLLSYHLSFMLRNNEVQYHIHSSHSTTREKNLFEALRLLCTRPKRFLTRIYV